MKHKCPVCQAEYIHKKRLISHMTKSNCGELAGQLGLTLDIDKRSLRGKNLERKKAHSENDEEEEPEITESVAVETAKPESNIDESADSDIPRKPKRTRKRRIKESLDCPNCGTEIKFSRTPQEVEGTVDCPSCNSTWEWEE